MRKSHNSTLTQSQGYHVLLCNTNLFLQSCLHVAAIVRFHHSCEYSACVRETHWDPHSQRQTRQQQLEKRNNTIIIQRLFIPFFNPRWQIKKETKNRSFPALVFRALNSAITIILWLQCFMCILKLLFKDFDYHYFYFVEKGILCLRNCWAAIIVLNFNHFTFHHADPNPLAVQTYRWETR